MTVLITGAGGYIGNVLTRLLLDKGYKVRALDTFWFGKERLPIDDPNLELFEGDIRSVSIDVMAGISSIIDLAAISNDPAGDLDPVMTWSINHLGRVRMAALGKSAGVSRYILPSSCSIYGFQDQKVSESSEVNPLTTYAKANLAAENDVLNLSSQDYCVTVVRQATVYGYSNRMRFDLAVNGMTKGFYENGKIPLMKDGKQWRPFVHVKDTSKAMLLLLEANPKEINGEIFNVGSDEQNYQIYNLAERVAAGQGVPFEFEWYGDKDHRSYQVVFEKIANKVGYTPDYEAEDGAREVREALDSGLVKPDDPSTITLSWYKSLIDKGMME